MLAPSLGRGTTIVVAVAAAVAAAVVAAVAVRLLLARRRPAAPLPPPQPLAHHRRQERAKFEGALGDAAYLAAPPRFAASRTPSNASLLGPESPPSAYGSVGYSSEDDGALSGAPLRPDLPLPNPSFETSSSSLVSADGPAPPGLSPSSSSSHSPRPRPRPHSLSASPARPRPRPLSSVSASTSLSRSRGLPHALHSHVQIVLPAPLALAPGTAPAGALGNRRSIVDLWAHMAVDAPSRPPSAPPAIAAAAFRPPPVPAIPAAYRTGPGADLALQDLERGRPRDPSDAPHEPVPHSRRLKKARSASGVRR